jgi:hypothetical protein
MPREVEASDDAKDLDRAFKKVAQANSGNSAKKAQRLIPRLSG